MTTENSHPSFWVSSVKAKTYPQQQDMVSVDVAIIGGGITGLTAATLLKRAGKTVAVIEAKTIGNSGVSSHTTAHITEHLDTDYTDLLRTFSKEDVMRTAFSARYATALIEQWVEDYSIKCDFTRLPGYYFTEKEDHVDFLRQEYEAARSIGIDVSLITEVPLPFKVNAAIRYANQAQFHPTKYLIALSKQLEGDGSYLFNETRVLSVEQGEINQVQTDKGIISAANVIVATHTPIELSILQTELTAYRSYVVAIRPDEVQMETALFWDTEDPYHYIRRVKDKGGDLIIIGGEDHKTGDEEDTESCFTALEAYAHERFQFTDIEHSWSAQYYDSVDGLPYIGRSASASNLYLSTGYSGTGMTFGTFGGQLISDLILGKDNPCAELYNPGRFKPLAAAGNLIEAGLNVIGRFVGDRIAAPEAESTSEIEPGEGKLMQHNGEKLAVYKDDDGKVYVMSAKCTHAKCIVHWNTAEKSWDCPCHGGRFDATGNVKNGPPTMALETRLLSDVAQPVAR